MNQIEKNKLISEAIKATTLKRKSQSCKTFKFKIDRSSLSKEQLNSIKMFFIETKRLYNYILSDHKDNIFDLTYKDLKKISYLDKDKNKIEYDLNYIGSSVISDTITLMKNSISGLSASKKNNNKVGSLKFKSECNSIRLRQYGITHTIKGSKFKIQGIKKPIRVSGLKQLNKYENIEYTTANLLYDGYNYFISLTCFIGKEENKIQNYKENIIGLDFGCGSTITLSNGEKKKITIGESERLKGLQARLATRKKRSNNWYKDRSLIRKEYNRISNQKNDITNKIVHDLTSNYKTIVIQDDQLNEWHETEHLSKTVQHSILGRLKNQLKSKSNVVVLDQWFPTTKHCFECGSDVDLTLSDRTFKCPNCGSQSDRDVHAANNMIEYYNRYIQSAGTVDLMPRKPIIAYKTYKHLVRQEAQSSLVAE